MRVCVPLVLLFCVVSKSPCLVCCYLRHAAIAVVKWRGGEGDGMDGWMRRVHLICETGFRVR